MIVIVRGGGRWLGVYLCDDDDDDFWMIFTYLFM